MKRLLILLLALLLTGCAANPLSEAVTPLSSDVALPQPDAPDSLASQGTATLWFRYLDEPLLASETRTLTLSPDQPMEFSLISALVSGCDISRRGEIIERVTLNI